MVCVRLGLALIALSSSNAFLISKTETRPSATTIAFSSLHAVSNAKNNENDSTSSKQRPKHILVVGGGIGGIATAYDLRHLFHNSNNDDVSITVVSEREHFEFTPSNPWVAVRKRSPHDIRVNLTQVLPRHRIRFVHGTAAKLDTKKQKLFVMPSLRDGSNEGNYDHSAPIVCDYDYLVIATGPKLACDAVPGLKSHGMSVCTTAHAMHSATMYDQLAQEPDEPILIGAAQGASCFGPAYEFALLLHSELVKRQGGSKRNQKMTFVTSEPYIGHLGLNATGDSKKILTELLKERNIEVYTNAIMERVTADSVTIRQLVSADPSNPYKIVGEKVIKIPARYKMVVPPFLGHDVWKHVPGLTDKKGMIVVNDNQQSKRYPNIFAVGVCVSIPPLEKTPVPTGVPKTGYMIESMGTAAANNIKYLVDLQKKSEHGENNFPESLPFASLGNALCIADFGDDGTMFLAMPQIPPRRVDLTYHGKLATAAKFAFEKYFLHKIQTGDTDPLYEKVMLHLIGVDRMTNIPVAKSTSPASKNDKSKV